MRRGKVRRTLRQSPNTDGDAKHNLMDLVLRGGSGTAVAEGGHRSPPTSPPPDTGTALPLLRCDALDTLQVAGSATILDRFVDGLHVGR